MPVLALPCTPALAFHTGMVGTVSWDQRPCSWTRKSGALLSSPSPSAKITPVISVRGEPEHFPGFQSHLPGQRTGCMGGWGLPSRPSMQNTKDGMCSGAWRWEREHLGRALQLLLSHGQIKSLNLIFCLSEGKVLESQHVTWKHPTWKVLRLVNALLCGLHWLVPMGINFYLPATAKALGCLPQEVSGPWLPESRITLHSSGLAEVLDSLDMRTGSLIFCSRFRKRKMLLRQWYSKKAK